VWHCAGVETPKRLTPREDVTRRLYLASGNRCAYPQCDQALMTAQAVLVGEIAHIRRGAAWIGPIQRDDDQ
jgi:hypothetical protein